MLGRAIARRSTTARSAVPESSRYPRVGAASAARAKIAVDLVSALLTAVISLIVIWLSIKYVQQAYVIDEGSPDPGGIPHRYFIKSLIPIGFALLFAQSIAVATSIRTARISVPLTIGP